MVEFITCFGDDEDKNVNIKKRITSTYNEERENNYHAHKQINGAKKNKNSFNKYEKNEKETSNNDEFSNNNPELSSIKQQINEVVLETDNIKNLDFKEYNEEIECGNIEYKLKLKNINKKKMDKLTTQMNFRLQEGNGECFYEIDFVFSNVYS